MNIKEQVEKLQKDLNNSTISDIKREEIQAKINELKNNKSLQAVIDKLDFNFLNTAAPGTENNSTTIEDIEELTRQITGNTAKQERLF